MVPALVRDARRRGMPFGSAFVARFHAIDIDVNGPAPANRIFPATIESR
jgi:hypothetical protein